MNGINVQDLARVEQKVDALAAKVDDLLLAWNTARGMVRFVKFLGGLATAITAMWALVQLGSHK